VLPDLLFGIVVRGANGTTSAAHVVDSFVISLSNGSSLSSPLGPIDLLTVDDAARFPSSVPFDIRIGGEDLQVTAIAGNDFTVTRGLNGT